MRRAVRALLLLAAAACSDPSPPDPWEPVSLAPYPNPFGPEDPLWAPQPHRDRPRAAALSADEKKLYVALPGVEDDPGDQVAVVDVAAREVRRRIEVGRFPVALALHPGGRYLVVLNLLSNWATVIDTRDDRVVATPPVPWYTTAIAFSPDGGHAWLANRWKDSLLTWTVRADDGGFAVVADDYRALPLPGPMGAPVGFNPDHVVVSADGARVVVSAMDGNIDVFAAGSPPTPVGRIAAHHSPIGGLALVGPWLVASHIGPGTGFFPDVGVDGDEDGQPGDGTGNTMFQDLQNELEVFDTRTLASAWAYTSDTICCFDYRDVDPDDPTRGLGIPAPETWPPERVGFLLPKERWIVAGALPTEIVPLGQPADRVTRLLVLMSASREAQRFDLDEATGELAAVDGPGRLYATGLAPVDAVARADGAETWVVDRLGETLTVLDTAHDPPPAGTPPVTVVVGDVDAGPFPQSDVELGELFNNETAGITVDGDQSCVHCHRDGSNLDRVVAMPLQTNRAWGSRQVQAYRGAFDSRPWFLEAAMDEKNFFPVLNEFNRKENFCCEEADPLIWSRYPTTTACLAAPATPGCNHVLDCPADPPPECAVRRYGSTYPTRDKFFLAGAERLAGRATSFGDSLVVAGSRDPIALDFDGITRTIGLFLLGAPRLPPNPNLALHTTAAARGAALYHRAEVGCAACHPLPVTSVSIEPDFSPAGVSVRLPPVITPTLAPDGTIADTITQGFRATFAVGNIGSTEQGPEGIHFGIPQLRGLWDRAPRFYHDGRSRSLADALLPPGHPALAPGEPGQNQRYGVIDTHGGTSQLTPDDVDDLIAFLLSL